MGWASAVKNPTRRAKAPAQTFAPPTQEIALAKVDWDRLVTLDFETFYDDAYTLSKLSTSEYIRDPRFKAQMVGIKIGNKPTKTFHTAASITLALRSINWDTHALLAHNTQFDGFILSHQYGIIPHRYYDTLSMARGLHSNEIGAGLHEVSIFYGGEGKIEGGLEPTKGVVNWPAQLIKATSKYCANDVEECYRIFREMAKVYPADEMELIHMTMRMFCAPVLRVDIPRVKAEHAREVTHRQKTLVESIPNIEQYDTWDRSGPKPKYLGVLDKKSGRDDLTGDERIAAVAKKVMGSNERFVNVLVEAGVPKDKIPMKLSDAWMKLRGEEREKQIDKKWTYAFAKTDLNFIDLPDAVWEMHPDWNPENPRDVMRASLLEDRLTRLVAGRLATKSTTNITRAARFIEAGRDGMKLPVGYGYARAHTLRWGGNNKMNMQNLVRGGELRLSILADEGHVLVVCDSGQIEARVNGWLWDQDDLLDAFRASDAYNLRVEGMEKKDRPLPEEHEKDAYCRYASDVYSRPINVNDKDERQLGKICVLGLGFKMGAQKLQMTLARGAMGAPRMNFPLAEVQKMVSIYRSRNHRIVAGWAICKNIISDMAMGVEGTHKCITWGGDGDGNGWIRLPNGLHLKYPDLKQGVNEEHGFPEWTYQAGEIRKKLYDGLLCENLVQALARIVVASQMLMVEKKYPIVMTTHDEGVAHVKKRDGAKAFAFMRKCFTTPLWWCPDIPLWAEGGYDDNYSK